MFGGSAYMDNLVPMHKDLNRSGGAYYKMEQHLKKHLDAGSKVEIEIDVIYGDSKYPDRPTAFDIEYKINGEVERQRFTNDGKGSFETAIPVPTKTSNTISDQIKDELFPRPKPTTPRPTLPGSGGGSDWPANRPPITIDPIRPPEYAY